MTSQYRRSLTCCSAALIGLYLGHTDRNGRQRQETVWVQPVQSGRRGSGCSRGDIQSCRHRRRRNPGRRRPPVSPAHHRRRHLSSWG